MNFRKIHLHFSPTVINDNSRYFFYSAKKKNETLFRSKIQRNVKRHLLTTYWKKSSSFFRKNTHFNYFETKYTYFYFLSKIILFLFSFFKSNGVYNVLKFSFPTIIIRRNRFFSSHLFIGLMCKKLKWRVLVRL